MARALGGKNKNSYEGKSSSFSFESKYHLSLGYRRSSWPVSLNGIALIFSDSQSDGKPIQIGCAYRVELTSALKPVAISWRTARVVLRYGGVSNT